MYAVGWLSLPVVIIELGEYFEVMDESVFALAWYYSPIVEMGLQQGIKSI